MPIVDLEEDLKYPLDLEAWNRFFSPESAVSYNLIWDLYSSKMPCQIGCFYIPCSIFDTFDIMKLGSILVESSFSLSTVCLADTSNSYSLPQQPYNIQNLYNILTGVLSHLSTTLLVFLDNQHFYSFTSCYFYILTSTIWHR